MKLYLVLGVIIVVIVGVICWKFGWIWAFTVLALIPISQTPRLVKMLKKEMNIIKLRWEQKRNPSDFLDLEIHRVEFYPEFNMRDNQRYLEIDLSITSRLLTDIRPSCIVGSLKLSGSGPDKFNIHPSNLIVYSQKKTEYNQVRIDLCNTARALICSTREKSGSVLVEIRLEGYHNGDILFITEALPRKETVPPFPT